MNEVVSFVPHKNKLVLNLMIDGGDMVFKNGGSTHDNGGHLKSKFNIAFVEFAGIEQSSTPA